MTRGNACTDERYKGTMTLNQQIQGGKSGLYFLNIQIEIYIYFKNNVIPAS